MDKIKDLLKQIGASEELADQIIGEMQGWKQTEKEQLEEAVRAKLERAKKICVEHVEEYKKELARKIEIFLESKVAAVERGIRERHAIEESKAVNVLKHAKALLEGIEFDGTLEDLQASKAVNEKLRKALVVTTEDRDKVKVQYQNAHSIANRALKRNRILETQVTAGKGETVSEGKKSPKSAKGTKLEESRPKRGKTNTTRPTLTESQTAAKPITEEVGSGSRGGGIESIASSIPEHI